MARARISADKEYIEIYDISPTGFIYDIPLSLAKTQEQKYDWIDHLEKKKWWSGELWVEIAQLFVQYA